MALAVSAIWISERKDAGGRSEGTERLRPDKTRAGFRQLQETLRDIGFIEAEQRRRHENDTLEETKASVRRP